MNIPQIDKLSVEQFKELKKALMSAFPTFDEFREMFRYTFNHRLETVIEETDTSKTAFKLIDWAESHGKMTQLIDGAYKEKPNNPDLKAFVKKLLQKEDPISKKKKTYKYFRPSIAIEEIRPIHIMDLRASKHKDFYYERDFDEIIYKMGLEGDSILLKGDSLAGKTRAFYELIKKLAKDIPNTYILFPENIPIDSSIEIPLQEGAKHIAFIEDIDDYYKNDKYNRRNYDKMIRVLIRNQVQVFATCRTGPEYTEYEKLSNIKTREVFRKITIGRVRRNVVEQFDESIIGNIEQSEFDGNIGSIFMDIEKMKDRYRSLEQTKTKEARLAVQVLRSLRAFYFASNFNNKSAYNAEAVKDYCLRLTIDKYASKLKIPAFQIAARMQEQLRQSKSKEIDKFYKNLPKALSLLERDDFNLNFIKQVQNKIEVEEVYLEKIVKYNPFTIKKNIDNLYDAKGEKEKNGFYVKTNKYNVLLKGKTYKQAVRLFEEMRRKRIVPNEDTYTVLIEKADTYEESLYWLKELKKRKIPTTKYILHEMIWKSKDFEEAFPYVGQLLDLLVEESDENPDIDYSYQDLTKNIKGILLTVEHIEEYLSAFWERNIRISSFIFEEIMNSSKVVITASNGMDWLEKYQIKPDKYVLDILLKKSKYLEIGLELLENELFRDIDLDTGIIEVLIRKSKSLHEGLKLLERETFQNIELGSSILERLIEKSSSLSEGLILLENEKFKKVEFNLSILERLIAKSNSLPEGLRLLENEKWKNVGINKAILLELIRKSSSLPEGLKLLNNEKWKDIRFDKIILLELIGKSNSLLEGLQLLEREEWKSVIPNKVILLELIRKSSSLSEGLKLLENEKWENIRFDKIILLELIGKSNSLSEGLELLESEEWKNVRLNKTILLELIKKSSSLSESLKLLENEKWKNIGINKTILLELIGKSNSLLEGRELLENEKWKNIKFDGSLLGQLIGKSSSSVEGLELLKSEDWKKVPVSGYILRQLIEKTSSTKEVKEVIDLGIKHSIKIEEYFLTQLVSRLSYYQDLQNLPVFWENYQYFPRFVFIDQIFVDFETMIQYVKNFGYKNKFLHNHMLYVLLSQQLISNQEEKDKVIKFIKDSYIEAFGIESYERFKDFYLFPDIQEMWNNYQFPPPKK